MRITNSPGNTGAIKVVIVDSDVQGDKRVQRSIDEAIGYVVVVDIRSAGSLFDRLYAVIACVWFLFRISIFSKGRRRILQERLGPYVDLRYMSGLLACLKWLMKAMVAAVRIRRITAGTTAGVTLYAHDLYCGVAGAIAIGRKGLQLIYDAHELEIHRNRRMGWMRVFLEYGMEQFVLNRCTKLISVNVAIRDVMADWYRLPEKIQIVNNNFYPHKETWLASGLAKPAIVYVGQGVNGRALELLDCSSATELFGIHIFLLGASLPNHFHAIGWELGPRDYECSLVALSRERRCIMWCCSMSCSLSYKLATPNKFFQALALGFPVIASRGTYLAEIVESYDIGAVFDSYNLSDIKKDVIGPKYEVWRSNVLQIRNKIRAGQLVI